LGQALDLPLYGMGILASRQRAQLVHGGEDGQALIFAEQALTVGIQGRLYRLEQTLGLHLLLAQGTRSLVAAGVLEGGGKADWRLSAEDIDALFAPLPGRRR